jgi:hypothetical protein
VAELKKPRTSLEQLAGITVNAFGGINRRKVATPVAIETMAAGATEN